MSAIKNIETGVVTKVDQTPVHQRGVWECGNKRYTDPSGNLFAPVNSLSGSVTVTDFWELFTVFEEAEIRALVDPAVKVWMRRLDDPRTQTVNLDFQPVRDAITYVAGVVPFANGRLEQILNGVLI